MSAPFARHILSNSGGKYHFKEDEKVLCYEPDPTKAKVLYDSKVLEVVCRKDTRGRKTWEYLIHFQGWNSSWDRYVAEEYVLKDTAENRDLQRFLNEEAQLLNQSLKKKKKKTIGEVIRTIRQDRRRCHSVPTPDRDDVEVTSRSSFSDGDGLNDSSDVDIDDEKNEEAIEEEDEDFDSKETFPLVIPEDIKRRLEHDFHFVTQEQRLVRTPATPCVAKILEDYVKYFGLSELLDWAERAKQESLMFPPLPAVAVLPCATPALGAAKVAKPCTPAPASVKLDDSSHDELKLVIRRINFVKEIIDGVRLMFDFLAERILMYKQELKQLSRAKNVYAPSVSDVQNPLLTPLIHRCKTEFQEDEEEDMDRDEPPPTKRLTRTSKAFGRHPDGIEDGAEASSSPRGRVSSSESVPGSFCKRERRSTSPDSRHRAREFTKELLDWKLIPTDAYEIVPPNPSLIYGIIHLMRLFVKMPEILSKTSIPRRRLRILVEHINLLLAFVAKHDANTDKRLLYYRTGEDDRSSEQHWMS